MKKLIKGLNLFFSQVLKSLQFLLIVMVVVTAESVVAQTTMIEFVVYFAFMVIVASIAGYCYMKFYEQYMQAQLRDEMTHGDMPEPDEFGT